MNKASFGSSGSFESFGSMGEEDEIIVVNPCQYILDYEKENDIILEEDNEEQLKHLIQK